MMMIKKTFFRPYAMIVIMVMLLPDALFADSRTDIVKFIPQNQTEQDSNLYATNFVATMESVIMQVRVSGYGFAATGIEPNRVHGMAQCYGDLSPVDCAICYGSVRAYMPHFYPVTGAMFYVDGCFSRAENYSFFHEYTGPNDQAICGNNTRQDPRFQDAARKALLHSISSAPNNKGYARAQVTVSRATNLSAYVLANCWRTISTNNCRDCLKNALASLSECFPATEGRAINAGCFMRYSDTNFLNPPPRSENMSRWKLVLVIVVSAVSAVAILITGAVTGVTMWNTRMIQKRREGDAKKLVKTLDDSSLNFKFSTLEKATESFDEAKKVGEGGYG